MPPNLFRGHGSAGKTPQTGRRSLILSERHSNTAYVRSDASGNWGPKTETSDEAAMKMTMSFLPDTFIISDLGEWGPPQLLFFSHFLPECPSFAVFSTSQALPISTSWRLGQGWRPWWLKLRCRWHEGRLQIRRPCTAKASCGCGRWQRKVPNAAVMYWDDRTGMLLVDWNAIYGDRFKQGEKKKEKKSQSGDIACSYFKES